MLVGIIPSLTINCSHLEGFQYLQNSSKTLLCVSTDGEIRPCPKAALDCFSMISHPLPSLINNRLNLPIGPQERSWRLNEGCFLESKKKGHKVLCPGAPQDPAWYHIPLGDLSTLDFHLHPRYIVASSQPSIFPISTLMDHLRPSKDSANCKVERVKYN